MNTKRMRNRYHRPSNGGSRNQNGQVSFNRNHVFDSNGPDVRIRGTAQQLHEKYLQHGRDALSSGDRVASESFFQYAEHYSRILNTMNQAPPQQQQQRQRPHQPNAYQENSVEAITSSQNEEQKEVSEASVVEQLEEPSAPLVSIEEEEQKPAAIRPIRRGRPSRVVSAEKKRIQEEEG